MRPCGIVRRMAPPNSTLSGTELRAEQVVQRHVDAGLGGGRQRQRDSTSSMIAAMSARSRPISRGSRKSSAALVPRNAP